jgi:hypothetical protein
MVRTAHPTTTDVGLSKLVDERVGVDLVVAHRWVMPHGDPKQALASGQAFLSRCVLRLLVYPLQDARQRSGMDARIPLLAAPMALGSLPRQDFS